MKKDKTIFARKRKYSAMVTAKNSQKTIKVRIERWYFHSLYNKRIKMSKTFLVHDEKSEANIGDKVQIIEARPISKLKRWRLVKILEKAK